MKACMRSTILALMVWMLFACQPVAGRPARTEQNLALARSVQGARSPATIAGRPLLAGTQAPDFRLTSATGSTTHLADELHAGGSVVLVFYTSGYCRVCEDALGTLETQRPAWQASGARLIAIATQTVAEAAHSAKRASANFIFLADLDGHVARGYGIWPLLPGRPKNQQSPMMVFILEPSGIIRWSGSMFVHGQPAIETILAQIAR